MGRRYPRLKDLIGGQQEAKFRGAGGRKPRLRGGGGLGIRDKVREWLRVKVERCLGRPGLEMGLGAVFTRALELRGLDLKMWGIRDQRLE